MTRKDDENELKFIVPFRLPETPLENLRKTRQECQQKLDELTSFITTFQTFGFLFVLPEVLTGLSIRASLEKVGEKTLETRDKEISSFLENNEVIGLSGQMCLSELSIYLSELQCAGYSASARTLRWILETTVRACEFQTDHAQPTVEKLAEEYLKIARGEIKQEGILDFLSRHNAMASFLERIHIYESNPRIAPSFRETVNQLNSRGIFSEFPELTKKLKDMYDELSRHVHPCTRRMIRILKEKNKGAFPEFDKDEFHKIYSLGIDVVDMILFLYIKAISHYYTAEDYKEFMNLIATRTEVPLEFASCLRKLKFSSVLVKEINWNISKEKETIRIKF